MSADNWAICPRCSATALHEYDEKYKAVLASYGTIPVDQFDAARDALKPPEREDFRTFREDYEFYGAESGEIVASYGGSCETCDLSATLKTSKRFWSESET